MNHRIMVAVALLVPAVLSAQRPTTARGRHVTASSGAVTRTTTRGSMGMTTREIGQLQAALQREGCNPGPIDGRFGARTHQAMACARQKLGVNGSDPNELLHALGLRFTMDDDTRGMGVISRSGRSAPGDTSRRARGDSSQLNPREKATRPVPPNR